MDLTGKILLAMPGMGDPRFEKSVIFMCSHSDEGGMGLIVNKPAVEVGFRKLLSQLSIEALSDVPVPEVFLGGPVEHARGFVLHSDEYGAPETTLRVEGGFAMTATLDVLEDIARGQGPNACLLALGYSGWGPGQLEAELAQNAWLVADASAQLIFDVDSDDKWAAVLAAMGIDPVTLSGAAGRA
ncbi:YqgE/AlgH family protein [Rhodobacteraceae bacterium SC52]|nr:YqgE/AlgH family protein [Rhodobacteraceae bacterium SC52]